MPSRFVVVLLSLVIGGLNLARSAPFNQHGMGARTTALAGAVTALSSEIAGVYYNPASIAGRPSVDVGIGFDLRAPQLNVDALAAQPDAESEPNDAATNYGVHVAARFPFLAKYDHPLTLGIGTSLPLSQSTRIEARTPTTQQFYRYDAHADSYALLAALAGRLHEWVSIGIGLHFLGGIDGYYDLELDFLRRRFQREVARAKFNYTMAVSAGVVITPTPKWSFGVSFRDSLQLDYSLDNQTRLAGLADFDIQGFGIALYQPQQMRAGLLWSPLAAVQFTLDLVWERWSRAPDPSAKAVVNVSSPELGLDNVTFSDRAVDLGAEDTLSPRVGAEWRPGRWALRGGYAFVPTPLPAQTGIDNYIDVSGHLLSAGAEVGFLPRPTRAEYPLPIGIATQALILPDREMVKTNAMDPVGSYAAGGTIWFANMTIVHRF
ncbi:MAG: hypothetical protein VX589_19965 [Myxococcota bacterium]|nr:hypothetical protein [Myxococcota bacterium]